MKGTFEMIDFKETIKKKKKSLKTLIQKYYFLK